MSQIPPIGDNRTGIATHPKRTAVMVKGTAEFPPSSRGSADNLAAERVVYAKAARPAGSLPPLAGKKPTEETMLFVDKLGARLAFERTGVRLYDALLAKHKALGSFTGGPTHDDLEQIRKEEHQHLAIVISAIVSLGGDPTAVTPSANIEATLSKGVMDVVVDPRTTLLDALHAMVVAELADNECWDTLILHARAAGHDQLAESFAEALRHEVEHLDKVRRWIAAGDGLTRQQIEHH